MTDRDTYLVSIDGGAYNEITFNEANSFDAVKLNEGRYHLIHNNESYLVELVEVNLRNKLVKVKIRNQVHEIHIKDPLDQLIEKLGLDEAGGLEATDVAAPMPGLVLDVMVSEGDEVVKDQPLIILEAMKMENVIKAVGDATVKEVLVEKQQKLEKGQSIITFE